MQTYTNKNMPTENSNIHNGHAYVDLGLPSGLLWATCNIGASSPEEYGDYFAWGETKPKQSYYWQTYKFYINGSDVEFSKYNRTDNLTELDIADDAAYVNWGGNWRMPTNAEQDELREHCKWTWTENYKGTGIKGRIVKSKTNSNIIFLPANSDRWHDDFGYPGSGGTYWSRSLNVNYVHSAYYLGFASHYVNINSNVNANSNDRFTGYSVRAVCPSA